MAQEKLLYDAERLYKELRNTILKAYRGRGRALTNLVPSRLLTALDEAIGATDGIIAAMRRYEETHDPKLISRSVKDARRISRLLRASGWRRLI